MRLHHGRSNRKDLLWPCGQKTDLASQRARQLPTVKSLRKLPSNKRLPIAVRVTGGRAVGLGLSLGVRAASIVGGRTPLT